MKRSSGQQLKLRTRNARCRKLGHWAPECPDGNGRQSKDERYDRRAGRPEDSSKVSSLTGPTERRPFFLGATWTFVVLDPGEVLWDAGAHEGLVGEQQLKQWSKLLTEYGLQVEWSQEKPKSASGIGCATQPTSVVHVPVGLAGSAGEIQGHGTSWTIKQWKRLAHYMLYVGCAAFSDTLARKLLMLIPTGRTEDIQLALRRREQREMKNKKSNVANLLESQTEKQPVNSVEEGAGRLRSST